MIDVIRKLLMGIISDIDSGNSNIKDSECHEIINLLQHYTRKDVKMSKYQAYTYLGISRATFDNMVREGKLPQGKSQAGFKEKYWIKKDLDIAITNKN